MKKVVKKAVKEAVKEAVQTLRTRSTRIPN
jgi:hypothetical protein